MQEADHQAFITNIIIQYSIVGLILLAVCAWMVWKIVRLSRKDTPGSSCCGCGLADSCKKKQIINKK